jgi:FAD/FMN-containing dehydrogenase
VPPSDLHLSLQKQLGRYAAECVPGLFKHIGFVVNAHSVRNCSQKGERCPIASVSGRGCLVRRQCADKVSNIAACGAALGALHCPLFRCRGEQVCHLTKILKKGLHNSVHGVRYTNAETHKVQSHMHLHDIDGARPFRCMR